MFLNTVNGMHACMHEFIEDTKACIKTILTYLWDIDCQSYLK